jgi:hypothetical protein
MEQAWQVAGALLPVAELADLLGERHRIISNDNDWRAAGINAMTRADDTQNAAAAWSGRFLTLGATRGPVRPAPEPELLARRQRAARPRRCG